MSVIDEVHWGGRDRIANLEANVAALQNGGSVSYVGAPSGDTSGAEDAGRIQAALDARADAGGGVVQLTAGSYLTDAALAIGTGVVLQGAGRYATNLKLADDAGVDVLHNADRTNGNPGIELRGFTIDGNQVNQSSAHQTATDLYGVNIKRCGDIVLDNVAAKNVAGVGIFVVGDEQSGIKRGAFSKLFTHDNLLHGFWYGSAMRQTHVSEIFTWANGGYGAYLDSSETLVNGIYADANSDNNIYIHNVWGCTYSNLVATRGQKHGIYVRGMVYSLGSTWRGQHNGQSGAGFSDVYFDAVNDGYGISAASEVHGIHTGAAPVAGTDVYGALTEDYGLYVADGVLDIALDGVSYGNGGTIGPFRFPSTLNNIRVMDTPDGGTHFVIRAGDLQPLRSSLTTLTYGTTVTTDASKGSWQKVTATNTTAFTIANPSNFPGTAQSQELTIEVVNSSGGAMGTITWGTNYTLVGGAFTNPATGKARWIKFAWNGSKWIEIARAGADY